MSITKKRALFSAPSHGSGSRTDDVRLSDLLSVDSELLSELSRLRNAGIVAARRPRGVAI